MTLFGTCISEPYYTIVFRFDRFENLGAMLPSLLQASDRLGPLIRSHRYGSRCSTLSGQLEKSTYNKNDEKNNIIIITK